MGTLGSPNCWKISRKRHNIRAANTCGGRAFFWASCRAHRHMPWTPAPSTQRPHGGRKWAVAGLDGQNIATIAMSTPSRSPLPLPWTQVCIVSAEGDGPIPPAVWGQRSSRSLMGKCTSCSGGVHSQLNSQQLKIGRLQKEGTVDVPHGTIWIGFCLTT